ncbi:MAG TPA: hypothetical protein VEI02_01440 [Planctomycetota bacterium]|nr:hypothetical protein [Planctomycetota bacterium]
MADDLGDLKRTVCDERGAPRPGAPLLAAHLLWRMGDRGRALRRDVAELCGVAEESFAAACDFHARVVRASADDRLQTCVGTSCRFDGAAAYHAKLIELLRAAGIPCGFEPVHCLDQCEAGPNVRFGDTVFCAKTCEAVVDERTWRGPSAGPMPVNRPNAPPVLD